VEKVNAGALFPGYTHKDFDPFLGAFPALRAGNRAFRSNLVYRVAAHKYFRFNPLRGVKPALFSAESAVIFL
jgi:hypothetical protein